MIGKKIRGYIPSYKIIILGAKFVGKTQLVYRFVNNSFQSIYEPTVEAKSYKKIIDLNENNAVDADYCILEIVDLFSPLHPLLQMKKERVSESDRTLFDYMEKQKDIAICNQSPEQEAYAYIIVFDRTSRQSFQKALQISQIIEKTEEINKKKAKSSKFVTKKMLLGNKIDRKGKVFDLKEEEMEEFYKNGCMFKDVSALTNYNVHKAFLELAKVIHNDRDVKNKIQRDRIKVEENIDDYDAEDQSSVDEPSKWRDCCGCGKKEEENEEGDSDDSEKNEDNSEREKKKAKQVKKRNACFIF